LALVAGVRLFQALGLRLWPCAFLYITGYRCLSCGATRAAIAFVQLDFVGSLLFNPLPVLLAMLMAAVLGFDVAGVVKNRKYSLSWVPFAIIGIVFILVAFCLLRNFGGILPDV
jgi:hypothetical protein